MRWVVLAAGVVAVACLVPAGRLRRVAVAGVAAAVLVGLAAPAAYAVTTAATAHSGSIPSVGTSASAMSGGPGGGTGERGGTPPGGMGGGMGGATSAELTALLSGTTSTWSAAVSSAQSAAGLELASGTAVMSTGGWSGSDAAVTLAQFQAAVANGEIHYYIGGGQGGGPGGELRQHQRTDRGVGRGELPGDDGGRPDGLRPHRLIAAKRTFPGSPPRERRARH